MHPSELARALARSWYVVLGCLVLGVVGAFVATSVVTPQYTAKISLYVAPLVTSPDPSAVYDGTQLALQRTSSYAQLITSDQVLRDVIGRLRLDTTPDDLSSAISTSTQPDTLIIDIRVDGTSPEQSARIADLLAGGLTTTVARLEQPADPALRPPVTVLPISPASASAVPTYPSPRVNYALGALVGLLVGGAAAVWRFRSGPTGVDGTPERSVDVGDGGNRRTGPPITTVEQLRDALDVPVLAVLAHDPAAQAGRRPRRTVHDDPLSDRAERFRQLRSELSAMAPSGAPSVLVVTGAVDLESTTATVCDLGVSMAESARRVLLIDADLRRPRVAEHLGLNGGIGVREVLAGSAAGLAQAARPWRDGLLDVLPSGQAPAAGPRELLGSSGMADLLAAARSAFDVVLIDAAPLSVADDAVVLAGRSDGVVLVIRWGATGFALGVAAHAELTANGAPVVGVVVTDAPGARTDDARPRTNGAAERPRATGRAARHRDPSAAG